MKDVFIVVKTGATEIRKKLPALLESTLSCVPDSNFAIFSDYEEDLFGHHIHDVLASVRPSIKDHHPDFSLYRRMQELHGDLSALKPSDLISEKKAEHNGHGENKAWVLDKWKFGPLIQKALDMRPNKRWYVVMETDTYVYFPNLLSWMSTLDGSKPLYLGNQMSITPQIFAHGGAAMVISNPAMKKAAARRKRYEESYDDYTAHHWAGDAVLGHIMQDAGVELTWSWPIFLEHDFGEYDWNLTNYGKKLWCWPVGTYHHMDGGETKRLWKFESEWGRVNPKTRTMLHRDVFTDFAVPRILSKDLESLSSPGHFIHGDWDNLSELLGGQKPGPMNLSECGSMCESTPNCVQYSLFEGKCHINKSMRLGRKAEQTGEDGKTRSSGWIRERVEKFLEGMEECPEEVNWIKPGAKK
ncbi:hypothetical protein GQ43DRAFT_429683 [Delitschia confertaspora ATCC 74209]|uniref:N-acetylgalactosaminide beta-1,3-galactosyltransferase n=1 Tax=Delitschia confertaspora ATCC 74209 TaxID=1513339 RepID=A0A9P4JR36_9PLEO|nr:hypothetical protein GQ43DRAFT_429683 [Delitschia confertaspora ATCC 74209]